MGIASLSKTICACRVNSAALWQFASFALLCLTPETAAAQRAPELGYVFPAGGRAGTTVEVRLGGYDWTPDMEYFALDQRVQLVPLGSPGELILPPPPYWFGPKGKTAALPLPREVPARLTIPADMPSGPTFWQAANANGGTATGVFVVSDSLEVVEDEKRTGVQSLVELPVTVSGRVSKIEEIDAYCISVSMAGPVTCELMARRLGANFHGVIEVHDERGRLIADVVDGIGEDVALTFAAAARSPYTIRVRDIDHGGDRSFVYRLSITPGPRVLAALPAAGKRGETRPVEFVGLGLATGQSQLETVTRQVTFPSDDAQAVMNYRLQTPFGTAPPFSLALSDLSETVDQPRTDEEPRFLSGPVGVTGVLHRRSREVRYAFAAKKGEVFSVAVEARRFGSPLDMAFVVYDSDGKEVAQSDDQPGTTDAGLDFTAPADGVFRVGVFDRAGKSGARDAIYRLELRRPRPDFRLQAMQRVNILIGGKVDLVVKARRTGGFTGSIALSVEGLPAGFVIPQNLVIPADKNELAIPLQVGAAAVAAAGLVQVIGVAQINDSRVSHVALSTASGSLCPLSPQENEVSQILVTSQMQPRCKCRPVDQDTVRKVNCGTTFPAEVIVERLEGYTGEVRLTMAARQSYQVQGISGGEVHVPPGVTRTIYPCFMPEWLETSRTSRMAIVSIVQVPDPLGRTRHLVGEVSGMITMSMEGALLKLSLTSRDLTVRRGEPFDVHLKLSRSVTLREPARLELKRSDNLVALFSAEPVVVPEGPAGVTFRVTPADDPILVGVHTIVIRATVLQDGYLPAVSEVKLSVEFPLARK